MPAGDIDYSRHGSGYAQRRRTDPSIAALIHAALGSARTVVNVGAGAGSYEPSGRQVVAVEPSEAMVAQRPTGGSPVLRGVAAALPFPDGRFDASMATVTVHQWPDLRAGITEMRRVTTGPVVVLTFDGDALASFWLSEYSPELYAAEASRMPPIASLVEALGPGTTVHPVPVPADCPDGFTEAFYGRPEAFLDPAVRASQSAWSFVPDAARDRAVATLADDLSTGRWDERFGYLRTEPEYVGSLRLVVGGR